MDKLIKNNFFYKKMLLKFKSYDNIVNVSIWRNTQVWLKGSVLKTGQVGKPAQGFESLFLRQFNLYIAG